MSQISDKDNLIQSFHTANASSALITFIIPTLNRYTLADTIISLLSQTNTQWKAIIIFDGCSPSNPYILKLLDNPNILCLTTPRLGTEQEIHNSAGFVRNIGLQLVDTPWVGFVDDDDILTCNYMESFIKELNATPSADVVVFKMIERGRIIPPLNFNELICGHVGISFVYRSSLIKDGFVFEQSKEEDYNLLKQFERTGKKIVLSPFITYLVRHSPYVAGNSKRIILN